MSTVPKPLTQDQLNEIFNELMNNKEIKELLQTMEEVKKGNIESNKENINNFAKKMREMSEMVPGSEELMKNIEVISVLHEKIFSYASRFRLYSLEFWNLYSILAEIRDKGDEPLSQFEQMIVKSTQPILWESNRTLKLSWMCCCFLSQYYGSEEDKEVIKNVMLTWESEMNIAEGRVEELPGGEMFGGMDRTNIAKDVFKEVNGTTFNDEVGTKFNDEVVDEAAVHFHKLKTGHVMDAIDMVKSSSSTPEEIAQARKVIVTAMSDNNTITDREAYMGLAEARHGPQVLTYAMSRAQQEKNIRFREQKPTDVLKINLDGLKPESSEEVVTQWNLVMTEILGLAEVNTASRDASLAAEKFCDHVLKQGFSTLVRKEMEVHYTEFGSDKTQEQNIVNKLDDDYTDITEKYKIILNNLFKLPAVETPGHYEGTAYAGFTDVSVPYKDFNKLETSEHTVRMKFIADKLKEMEKYIDDEIERVKKENTPELKKHLDKLNDIAINIKFLKESHDNLKISDATWMGTIQRTSDPRHIMYTKLAALLVKVGTTKTYVGQIKQALDTKEREVKVPKGMNPFNKLPQQMLPGSSQGSLVEPISENKLNVIAESLAYTEHYRRGLCMLPYKKWELNSTIEGSYAIYSVSSFWADSRGDTVSGIHVDGLRGAQLYGEVEYTISQMNILLDKITKLKLKLNSLQPDDIAAIVDILSFIGIQGVADNTENLEKAEKEILKNIHEHEKILYVYNKTSRNEGGEYREVVVYGHAIGEKEQNKITEIQSLNKKQLNEIEIGYKAFGEFINSNSTDDNDKVHNDALKQLQLVAGWEAKMHSWNQAAGAYVAGAAALGGKAVLGFTDTISDGIRTLITHTPILVYLAVIFLFFITYLGYRIIMEAIRGKDFELKSNPFNWLDLSSKNPREDTVVEAPGQRRTWVEWWNRKKIEEEKKEEDDESDDDDEEEEEEEEDIIIHIFQKVEAQNYEQNVIDYNNYINIVNLVIAYDSSKPSGAAKPRRLSQFTPGKGNTPAENRQALGNRIRVTDYKENLKRITDASEHTTINKLREFIHVEPKIKETIKSKFASSNPKLHVYITKEGGVNQVNKAGMTFIKKNTTAPAAALIGEGGGGKKGSKGIEGGKITKRKRHLKNKTRRKKRVTKNLKKRKGLKKTGKKK